jgi:hypothetical protein
MILKGEGYQTASKPPAVRGKTWPLIVDIASNNQSLTAHYSGSPKQRAI